MSGDLTSNAAPPLGRRAAGLAAGLALIGLLVPIDNALGTTEVVVGMAIIGPFVTGLVAGVIDTAFVGIVAITVAGISGTWNDNFGDTSYLLGLAGVTAGAAFALIGAQARIRDMTARRRLQLLAEVAEVADGHLSLQGTVERLAELLVPDLADVAAIDAMQSGALKRLAVERAGDDPAEVRDEPGPHVIVVPLQARRRLIGVLTLNLAEHAQRRYRDEDRHFSEVLAGRVALALDNAGLFSELESMEAQLTAALGSLSDAVTVQNATGRLVYVNEAAARVMGFTDSAAMLTAPPDELVGRYDLFDEDGAPVDPSALPGRRVLAGEDPPPLTVRSVLRETGEAHWQLIKSSPVLDHEGRPRLAVNVIEDITELKRAEFGRRLLLEAGEILASSLDFEQTLQRVAELAVPQLADWCGVSMPDPHGAIQQVAVAHVDPEKRRFAREYSRRYPADPEARSGVAEVLRTGRSQLITDISDEFLDRAIPDAEQRELLRSVGMRSAMLVPIVAAGRPIGALNFVSSESGRRFDATDLALAEELGRRAGTAVQNARLYSERTHIARTLQTGLLPDAVPEIPGLALATLYRPAGQENWVGGDFYDAFPVSGGWMVVVGDVAGRGPEAAALTALARHTLRTAATVGAEPLRALDHLNRELLDRPATSLVTVACALVRTAGGRTTASVACAGHPPALLVRGDEVTPLGHFGPMLGAFAGAAWETVDVTLREDDVLVLYTDGVIDTRGDEERFGEDRLRATVRGATDADDAVLRIDRALQAFEAGEQADDTAVLAIRCGPAPAATAVEHRAELPGGVTAPGRARRTAVSWLGAHLEDALLQDVQVLVSELVTNAVRHAGAGDDEMIVLEVGTSPEHIRLAVTDPGPGFRPQLPPTRRPEGGGAGLVLVDVMAQRWGVEPGPPSTVWCELPRNGAVAG